MFPALQEASFIPFFFFPPPGYTGYKTCYQEVLKAVKGIIHQPLELEDNTLFSAFSYYYDGAVDAGLIS